MITRLRWWLVGRLLVVVRWLSPGIVLPPEQFLFSARQAVADASGLPHTGHYKRVVALRQLAKLYPRASRRALALAVELAVAERDA